MPAFRINDAELDALMGEGADLFQLYVGALRPRMDFKTGVVGRRPGVRISYQALKEWTERAARSGVRFLAHDKSKLQRMLTRLQQLGLLRKLGGPYDLVFVCPLADRDNCDQKQADTKSIQLTKPAKPKPAKASRHLSTEGKNGEAATHQESGNTLKPPPPTSSGLRPEEDGSIDPPAPAAQEAENPNTDETPIAQTAQQLSEERHEQQTGGGERPPAGRSDDGAKLDVSWETHLHWPTGITDRQRAYVARRLAEVPESLRQRVLDEWHGATRAGTAKKPWPYFNGLLRNAKQKGEAWQTIYAEGVAEARELERLRLANDAAAEVAHSARMQGPSVSPGELLQWKRDLDAARERRSQA
ncbi:conserved hypothetical protein [Cupriavidus necator]|uniref:Uncharacterized protein n=1 Tax=Cupriavidus necator TaxID=106590 RepID=A0A1K0I8H0_CUPNE|nr:conserved hypothetical protein [Cupriavidus necator]